MTSPRVIHLRSAAEIRAHAGAWDDLWWRGDVALPTVRAELTAQWIEQFAPRQALDVIVIESDGQWVAVLPLILGRRRGIIRTAELTANPWSAGGDLLIDPECDVPLVAARLAAEMARLPCAFLWFEEIPLASARWQALAAAIGEYGLSTAEHQKYDVVLIDVVGDWGGFEASRSKNIRQQSRRRERQLAKLGNLQLVMHTDFDASELGPVLRRAFEVEDRSWKGAGGSTVLQTPGMFDYFVRQSRSLAEWGQLVVFMLELDGRPIAFEYGYSAKGVYFPHKISFDDRYAQHGPGQVIRRLRMQRLFETGEHQLVDNLGPVSRADRQWSTRTYPLSRLVVAPRRATSRALLSLYRAARPAVGRLRARRGDRAQGQPASDSAPPPQLVG